MRNALNVLCASLIWLSPAFAAEEEPGNLAGKGNAISIVQDQWNYISYNNGDEELYDHLKDPGAVTNLLTPDRKTQDHAAFVSELKKFIPETCVAVEEAAVMNDSE